MALTRASVKAVGIALVFNIFFEVMVRVVFDRSSIGKAAMDDFIRVASTDGNTRDILREVLWARAHSDDASIAS